MNAGLQQHFLNDSTRRSSNLPIGHSASTNRYKFARNHWMMCCCSDNWPVPRIRVNSFENNIWKIIAYFFSKICDDVQIFSPVCRGKLFQFFFCFYQKFCVEFIERFIGFCKKYCKNYRYYTRYVFGKKF
jgi:hypothetical protein